MRRIFYLFLVGLGFLYIGIPQLTRAASLSLSPTSGTFTVGSTFDVSVFLDTQGQSINAAQISLSFPPDKLQLVSPTAGKSVIGVWTSQPGFNNATGKINLEGGIPGGINVSNGLLSTFTFRVRSVGSGILKFLDDSKVLLNDGLGTDALRRTQNGVYQFVLPPPEGPIVASKTHPEESRWYSKSFAQLDWVSVLPGIQGYSYVLDDDHATVPDNISEGVQTRVIYKNISDGTHYFHIKSLRDGMWGGVTHFGINNDAAPPADFEIDIIPSARTTRSQPIIQFFTTDALSGIDHYELKVVPLDSNTTVNADTGTVSGGKVSDRQQLFIEAQSPFVPSNLSIGDYDVIMRAYDKAGNFKEIIQRLERRSPFLSFVTDEGLEVQGYILPWVWVGLIVGLLIGVLVFVAIRMKWLHRLHHGRLLNKELPENLKNQLEELKKYREKYGKALVLLLIVGFSLAFGARVSAQTQQSVTVLAPPLVTTVSRNISNEEIFYVGGKTDVAGAQVVIYLQNLQTGETVSESVISDKRGDWFYRHDTLLSIGNYLLWVQSKVSDEVSPPSPQVQLTVSQTALQFGSSRISFETLYFILTILFFLIILGLVCFIVYHSYHGRRKRALFMREVGEAEESLRRGFAVLRRDIEAELGVVRKIRASQELNEQEKQKEAQLMRDLEAVQKYIGKEIWDIEAIEHNN